MEGKSKGMLEGMHEKQKQFVMNMYNDNYDIETIAKLTELSIGEINKIIADNKK